MRIDSSSPATNILPADWNTDRVSKGAAGSVQSATEDRTTFSSAGATVSSLTAQAMTLPEVRQDKVNALAQSVSSGAYALDPAAIAGAIRANGGE
jgi:flagellar biosynthesis anti-sigma factor FlgM